MADVIEAVPPAVDASGNLTVWWLDEADYADLTALTAAELADENRITYSFVPGGWAPTADQAVDVDDRLTYPETLQAFGKITTATPLRYVDSDDPGSAAVRLVAGSKGAFVERRNVANGSEVAAGQKYRAFPRTLGIQVPEAPPETGKFTIAQATISNGQIVNGTVAA